jgi:hypothetical protein
MMKYLEITFVPWPSLAHPALNFFKFDFIRLLDKYRVLRAEAKSIKLLTIVVSIKKR